MSARTRAWAWLTVAVVVAAGLTVGVVQGRAPRSEQDRIDAIAKTIKCPVCTSESVYESRSGSAEDIRREIADQVAAGRSADEVRAAVAARYGDGILLKPPSGGLGGLVWVLPVVGLVLAAAGLVAAFRRWRNAGAGLGPATAEDEALVAQARSAREVGSSS